MVFTFSYTSGLTHEDGNWPFAIILNCAIVHKFAEQLVNRSDGVVDAVWIAGTQVWDGSAPSAALGRERLGRPLTFSGRANA